MQYIIMLTIVLGLALSDFVTGIFKGYVTKSLSSEVMRKGGINKITELIIMATTCGLEIGIKALGHYYTAEQGVDEVWDRIAAIAGTVSALAVFAYILLMEIVSILENYSVINPGAAGWINKLLKRLKVSNDDNSKEE